MSSKLFVGNLSYSTTEDDLRAMFAEAGTIVSVTIPMDRATERPRGFAFVEMSSPVEAAKGIQVCNGKMVGGRQITVNEARPPENRGGGGGFGAPRDGGGRDGGGRRDFGGGGGGGGRDGGGGGGRGSSGGGNDRRSGGTNRRRV